MTRLHRLSILDGMIRSMDRYKEQQAGSLLLALP